MPPRRNHRRPVPFLWIFAEDEGGDAHAFLHAAEAADDRLDFIVEEEVHRTADVAKAAVILRHDAEQLGRDAVRGEQIVAGDRKSVRYGKRVSVRVALGGRRSIQKTKLRRLIITETH